MIHISCQRFWRAIACVGLNNNWLPTVFWLFDCRDQSHAVFNEIAAYRSVLRILFMFVNGSDSERHVRQSLFRFLLKVSFDYIHLYWKGPTLPKEREHEIMHATAALLLTLMEACTARAIAQKLFRSRTQQLRSVRSIFCWHSNVQEYQQTHPEGNNDPPRPDCPTVTASPCNH